MKYLILIISALTFSTASMGQVVVKVRPAKPKVIVAKPAKAPGPNMFWMDGHWKWAPKAKKYVWVKGRWAKRKKGHRWVPGHWKATPGGHKWIPGHWKR